METLIIIILILLVTTLITVQVFAEQKWRRENPGRSTINEKDHYLLFGLYANKSDKRIFVSKRSGGGYTFNLGNPIGVLLCAILLSLILYLFVS